MYTGRVSRSNVTSARSMKNDLRGHGFDVGRLRIVEERQPRRRRPFGRGLLRELLGLEDTGVVGEQPGRAQAGDSGNRIHKKRAS